MIYIFKFYNIDGRNLQSDLIESILPDGIIIKEESSIDLEHQYYLLTPDKIEVMQDSKIFTI